MASIVPLAFWTGVDWVLAKLRISVPDNNGSFPLALVGKICRNLVKAFKVIVGTIFIVCYFFQVQFILNIAFFVGIVYLEFNNISEMVFSLIYLFKS